MIHKHQTHQHHNDFVFNATRMLALYPFSLNLVSPCHTKPCMLGDNVVIILWKVSHTVVGTGVGIGVHPMR